MSIKVIVELEVQGPPDGDELDYATRLGQEIAGQFLYPYEPTAWTPVLKTHLYVGDKYSVSGDAE